MIVLALVAAFLCGCGTTGDITNHRASFLFDNALTRTMNGLSYNMSDDRFEGIVKRCAVNGDTAIYLYFSNQGDGTPVPTSFYENDKFGGEIDDHRLKDMQERVQFCQLNGLRVVAWLFADDSSKISKAPLEVQQKYIDDVVREFDRYISEYVLGLEMDEHMKSRMEPLAVFLDSKTAKKIGLHLRPGRWTYSRDIEAVDHHYHQFGFNKPASFIESETAKIKALVGKPVIAAEYDLNSDSPAAKARGAAAINGGAAGTGNGR